MVTIWDVFWTGEGPRSISRWPAGCWGVGANSGKRSWLLLGVQLGLLFGTDSWVRVVGVAAGELGVEVQLVMLEFCRSKLSSGIGWEGLIKRRFRLTILPDPCMRML